MQHAFLKEFRGNWTHSRRFNDGDGKSKVSKSDSLHISYQTALCSPLRMGSSLGNKQAFRVFCFPLPATGEHDLLACHREGGAGSLWNGEGGGPKAGLGKTAVPSQNPSWPRRPWELGLLFKKCTLVSVDQCPPWSRMNSSSLLSALPPQSFIPKARGPGIGRQGAGELLALVLPLKDNPNFPFPQQLFWMRETQS